MDQIVFKILSLKLHIFKKFAKWKSSFIFIANPTLNKICSLIQNLN